MPSDLFIEEADGKLWVLSFKYGTQVCAAREENNQWFAAEDDSFFEQIGPFNSSDEMLDHIEQNKLFTPRGNPGV